MDSYCSQNKIWYLAMAWRARSLLASAHCPFLQLLSSTSPRAYRTPDTLAAMRLLSWGLWTHPSPTLFLADSFTLRSLLQCHFLKETIPDPRESGYSVSSCFYSYGTYHSYRYMIVWLVKFVSPQLEIEFKLQEEGDQVLFFCCVFSI